ncbi:glycosyl hydrolase [Eubacterium sp. LFL-14]|uniref:glucan endo-1,3-beta-D-glucosidase n=1 Tax=Eubacterium album TaxID=2978477 RepID=A0ABT2LXT9_9FIRM|nr:glycosyl hydrolase [Eubacterium sp. LFL-14]MCT7398112.1 glycosyl hydrolase [Eubacterium sp. LFL-14]
MKGNFKKGISVALSLALTVSSFALPDTAKNVNADNLPTTKLGVGSIGTGSNEPDAAKLPRTSTQGKYRFTTDNYNSKHKALDTNDWASNWLWDLEGDRDTDSTNALSGTAYALPLCYLMKKDGLRVTKPAMTSSNTNVSAYNIKDNDTLCDFKISPDWTCTNNNIDEVTDWSYKAVTTNPQNAGQKMYTTMTQGSPFAFIEMENTNTIYLEKLRVTFPSEIIYEDTYNGSKMVVFRTNDITSSVNGYPSATYQYYAVFLPENTTVTHMGTTDKTNNDKIGKLKFTFPSNNKAYMSVAWLCESRNIDNNMGIKYAKEYRPYAFNIITNTTADYSYNESTGNVQTKYTYSFSKKAESTADGTIMGILPHQYKNMSNVTYMDNKAITLRGYMKFIKGSSYTTNMTYNGIIPYMPSLSSDDSQGREELQKYVNDFVNKYMTGAGNWTLANDEGNETYYHGKKLNRSAQVVAAAKAVGDEGNAQKVLNGLEKNLEDWFTYSGNSDKHYFTYLGEGVGALLGFQSSFNSVDQFNDHHFHYGYFIESAASVGLYDREWLNNYKDVVKQLIYDIACPYRNNKECVADCGNAYPYLRSFSPYEGHSWASGYEDERTGNNQESTSEAINAWAGIILFGELTNNTKIRDLGIYLYTTESEAADEYWFDKDEETYKIDSTKFDAPMASMVWGGKVDYSTWFGQQYTQGIQICPINSWSFYLGKNANKITGKDYIKKYYNADKTYKNAKGGSTEHWNDMWAEYYAIADPDYAMNTVWTKNAINDGESQAHTYHFIRALQDYGTPDLTFKSNSPTASVFNKNGAYTYVAYNASNTAKTVTFTSKSGQTVSIKASPNTMTTVNANEVNKSSYVVEYYGKDLNSNNYSLLGSEVKYADAGANVTATEKNFTGFKFDNSNSNNIKQGTVNANGSLVLKMYYNRETYSISYDLVGGVKNNTGLYPTSYIYGQQITLDTPKRDGYDFAGWYKESTYNTKVDAISSKVNGNITLYAKWIPAGTISVNEDMYLTFDANVNGTFTIVGDKKYNAVSVLYKVVNTESEAKELAESKAEVGFVSWGMEATDTGWSHTRSLKGDEGKYIVFYFIRYDENGGYKSEYGYGKIQANGGNIETTKAPETTTTKVAETTTKAPETTTKISETTTKVLETTKPAAGDSKYESLNYKDIANNNNGEFDKGLLGCKYAVISGEINACLFQNKGFSELYMAVGGMGAGNFKATINGRNVTKTQGTGVFMNPASDFLTYKYNVVEISSDDGTATVIILNPNKTGTYNQTTPETTTKSQETTTKAPETTTKSQETTTKAPETTTKKQEQTTKAPETTTKISETTTKVLETTKPAAGDSKYESLNYKDIDNNNNGEFDKGLLGCKYALIEGKLNVCQFQNTGFGELYMAVGGMGAGNFKATINGRNVTKTQGTGVFINPASDYVTYKYNVVEISSDDGKAIVIILNPNKTGTYNQTTSETTTKAPETTTKSQETTTKAPETTTKSQETTTKAPETTTKSQETTTKAPETTTKKQEQTTKAPETTTKSQETTTKAPETTTKSQETTTKAPETTTKKQEQTTKAPETTTKSQETTTKAPETTTKKQEQTTKAPETTKKQEQTTKAPETTTKKQEQTTKAPETTKSQQTDNNNTITTDAKNTTTAGNSEGINGTSAEKTALGRAAFSKKIKKKLSLKKIKVSIKKVENATGYEVRVATSKKFKKTLYKKSYKKVAFTLKSKKLANKKKLYIKVRAYVLDGTNKIYGKWSKVKKVKIK